jgi:RimJ/RimL family protein N-acetyltransferase
MISKITQKVRRQCLFYRELGFAGFLRHILADSNGFHQYAIFEADLSKNIPEEKAKIRCTIRLLTINDTDIDRMVKFWPDMYAPPFSTPQSLKELMKSRLTAGEECLIAEYDGKLMYMNWIGFQNTHTFEPHELKRGLCTGEAEAYNAYCAPEYRGNSLMGAVHSNILSLYKGRGYEKVITYVQPDNNASIKVVTRIYGKPVQKVSIPKICGFSFYFLSKRSE